LVVGFGSLAPNPNTPIPNPQLNYYNDYILDNINILIIIKSINN